MFDALNHCATATQIFDWVVMTLFGERLGLDDLQFSYQKKCSTNMCTWLVVESINHFSRNGSSVYTCFMDMKKAFDMMKYGTPLVNMYTKSRHLTSTMRNLVTDL